MRIIEFLFLEEKKTNLNKLAQIYVVDATPAKNLSSNR